MDPLSQILQQDVMTQQYVRTTGAHVYASLVAAMVLRGEDINADKLRAVAANAKVAAPFLAEAYGMLTVNVKDEANG